MKPEIMEIRIIGNQREIEAAVALIGQSFTIHQDSGSYKGRNPRYTSDNRDNYIRKLTVTPKPRSPRTGGSTPYLIESVPAPDAAVLGGRTIPAVEPEPAEDSHQLDAQAGKTWGLGERDRLYYGLE